MSCFADSQSFSRFLPAVSFWPTSLCQVSYEVNVDFLDSFLSLGSGANKQYPNLLFLWKQRQKKWVNNMRIIDWSYHKPARLFLAANQLGKIFGLVLIPGITNHLLLCLQVWLCREINMYSYAIADILSFTLYYYIYIITHKWVYPLAILEGVPVP